MCINHIIILALSSPNRTKHEEIVLGDMYIQPGEPWEYCPRDALRRVAKIMKDEFNLVIVTYSILNSSISSLFAVFMFFFYMQVVNAGFENEFYLLKNVVRYV